MYEKPLPPKVEYVWRRWFDSGCSWASVLQRDATLGLPADLYLEG